MPFLRLHPQNIKVSKLFGGKVYLDVLLCGVNLRVQIGLIELPWFSEDNGQDLNFFKNEPVTELMGISLVFISDLSEDNPL